MFFPILAICLLLFIVAVIIPAIALLRASNIGF